MHKLNLLLLWVCIAACNSTQTPAPQKDPEQGSQNNLVINNETDILNAFQSFLSDQPQTFIVPAKKIKTVVGKKGLKIIIDPSRLEMLDGSEVTGDITVTIREMQRPEEMIAENCATVSNGRLLSSGGSYYIGMASDGKELRLKKNSTLKIEFPKIFNKEMELFYGERTTDGMMNWQQANIKLSETKVEEEMNDNADVKRSWGRSQYIPEGLNFNGIDATANYQASIKWLKAFEDSVMEMRKAFVLCDSGKMTKDQINNYLHKRIKIGRRDVARLRMVFTSWPYHKNTRIHISKDQAYYLVEARMADTVLYYSDSIKFAEGEIKPAPKEDKATIAIATDNYNYNFNNLKEDIDVDIIPVKTSKSESLKKTVVRYYDPVGIPNLGWINCDRFYTPQEFVPQYTFEFKGDVPENVGVYSVFRGINAMLSHRINTKGKTSFVINEQIPLNEKVEFLIYSKIGNDFVECRRSATVAKDMIVSVAFKKVPESEIKKAVFLN